MSPENLAQKLKPYRRNLLWIGAATLIFVGVNWKFDVLAEVNSYISLAVLLVAAIVLVTVLSVDIFVSSFHPKDGFLRPSSKWGYYFPWLRYVVLLLTFLILVLPLVAIVVGVT